MAKHKEEKTNVMRVLDQKKIPYTAHTYDPESGIDGVSVARSLGQDPAAVFKTLVARGASGGYYVFDIPVAARRCRASGVLCAQSAAQHTSAPASSVHRTFW